MRKLISITICILLNGCHPQKAIEGQPANPDKLFASAITGAETKIVYLTLHVTLIDSINDTYSFSTLNTQFAEGILKKGNTAQDTDPDPFYFYCEITDGNKKRQDLIKVQNPLRKVYEYSPETGILDKRIFTSKSGEFTVRFQLTANSKFFSIYRPDPASHKLKQIYYAKI